MAYIADRITADFEQCGGRPCEAALNIPQSDWPVLALSILGTLIYTPTAGILHQFAEVAVLGRETRVDEYEQPVFAWR